MKLIVVGLGSMGRRRARLLHVYDSSAEVIGIDTREDRRRQAVEELGIETAESIEDVCTNRKIDIAFVSTSPLSHPLIIKKCLEYGLHVFTELNLADTGYEENLALADKKGCVLFLSSTFLYRKETQYIKEAVRTCRGPLSYGYHAGQYLPDWHPWENYKNFFAGSKEANGCRELMAIEFPWIFDVFGDVKDIHSVGSKNSTLDVDFPDSYQIMFEHETGHRGIVAIDVVSRKAVRNFELSGENLYLTWDGTPNGLRRYDIDQKIDEKINLYETISKRADYGASIIEDAYLSEIANFMDTLKGNDAPRYSFEKDKKVLSIIDKVERR